jgi:hypothetical protein
VSWVDRLALPPKIMEAFHLAQVGIWTAMIPVAVATPLKSSVPFLVMISILALVFSELAAFQASLSERRLDESDDFGND